MGTEISGKVLAMTQDPLIPLTKQSASQAIILKCNNCPCILCNEIARSIHLLILPGERARQKNSLAVHQLITVGTIEEKIVFQQG